MTSRGDAFSAFVLLGLGVLALWWLVVEPLLRRAMQ